MSAEINQKNSLDRNQDRRRATAQETANLDRRYGRIGIAAVAAALQFCGTSRNHATPKASRIEDRFIEIAA